MPEAMTLPMIDVSTPLSHQLYVSALSSDGVTIHKPTTPGGTPKDKSDNHSLPLQTTSTTPHNHNTHTPTTHQVPVIWMCTHYLYLPILPILALCRLIICIPGAHYVLELVVRLETTSCK